MYPVLLLTERPKWSNRWEFFLYTAALLFSPFSVWKFPVLWSQYGGDRTSTTAPVSADKAALYTRYDIRSNAACLLPYLVCLLSVGLPLVCLELSLGQFMQRSGPRVWAVVPLFKGLCATSAAVVVLKASTNLVLAAWTGCYMYLVLTNQLPTCVTDSASPRLSTGEITNGNGSVPRTVYIEVSWLNNKTVSGEDTSASEDLEPPLFRLAQDLNNDENLTCHQRFLQYWRGEMVETSLGLSSPGSAVLEVFIMTVVVSIVCYILVVRDIRWSAKIMYILAPLSLAGCLSIIVWTASTGWSRWRDVYYLMRPDFGKLANPEPWFGSVKMVVLTLGLGHHVVPFLGSYNKLDNHVIKDSCLVCVLAMFANVMVSLCVCGLLGTDFGLRGELADPWLLFASVFAELRTFENHVILSSVFCVFIIVIIISATVVYIESVVSSLVDLSVKLKRWRLLIVTGTVSTCFLLTIPMSTQGGIFVFQLFEKAADGGFVIVLVVLLECLAIAAVYGASRFYDNLESMTGSHPHWWMKFCWLYLSPVLLLATLIYQEYRSPFFALGSEVGRFDLDNVALLLLVVVVLVQTPVVGVCVVCCKRGSWVEKIKSSLKPELKPHQVPIKWRLEGHWTKFGSKV